MFRILGLLLVGCVMVGCGDGRGVSELIQVREDLIEEIPIIEDAEECITGVDVWDSLGQVDLELDLDCLLNLESDILDKESGEDNGGNEEE
ncbi:hypothetical protein C6496_18665 [Candidatus Poribacteria bacterium]|nr:MAG: hypothetical protein C6496_18665 [Candidatus Poribacteria bacterium]